MGLQNINEAKYAPIEMSQTWEQLIGEIYASARMRRKRPERGYSLLATHPAPEERMKDLRVSAAELTVANRNYETGRARYLQAIGPHRAMLLEDQVKLNDPGASLYIINHLAQDGWNGFLRFYEAEVWRLKGQKGDAERANALYAQAVQHSDAPAEAWRQHGFALLRRGQTQEGKRALTTYLAKAPAAPDAPIIRHTLQQ